MAEIIFYIIKGIARFVIEIPFIYTGEILMYLGSFGRRKPRWDLYLEDSASKFIIFTKISLWLGAAFWIGIASIIVKLKN